jgi:hypothetical protein
MNFLKSVLPAHSNRLSHYVKPVTDVNDAESRGKDVSCGGEPPEREWSHRQSEKESGTEIGRLTRRRSRARTLKDSGRWAASLTANLNSR